MKRLILAGSADQTLDIFIQDSTSTTGGGKTGLAFNTSSLTCYYRKGATGSATALTLATQTVGGAHSDGGFVEVDATNMPGIYRLDLSDTIVATAGSVSIMLKGATGMAPVAIELQVVAFNPNDSVRLGLTALPNAAADAAGGLPISDAGGLDLDARLDAAVSSRMATYTQPTGFLAATFPGTVASTTNITAGTITTVTNLTNAPTSGDLTATMKASINAEADAALSDVGLTSIITGRIDAAISTRLASAGYTAPLDASGTRSAIGLASANLDTQISALATASDLATVAGYIDTEVASLLSNLSAVKTKTDQLTFTVSNQVDANALSGGGGGGGLDAAGVRAAIGLASANLDTQLADIPTNSELASSLASADDAVLAQMALVKAKTDNLPTDPADQSVIIAATDAILAAIAALNNLSSAQAQTAAAAALSAYDPPTKAETDALFTTAMTESYAANGAAPSPAQALFAIHQRLMSFVINGTSRDVKELDGSTTAFTTTLNDATNPTGETRS